MQPGIQADALAGDKAESVGLKKRRHRDDQEEKEQPKRTKAAPGAGPFGGGSLARLGGR